MQQLRRQAKKWIRLPARWLIRERRPGATVLMYHRVGGGTSLEIDLSVSVFRRQLEYLRRRFMIVSMDTLRAMANAQPSHHTDVLALTFDDGYEEMYTKVLPLLVRYRVPATVYLPTAYIQEQRRFDWGQYAEMGRSARPKPMTWPQVRELLNSGLITLGAHTHTHHDLSLATPDRIRQEIERSNQVLTRTLGIDVRHFAFPFSHASGAAHAVARDYYRTAVIDGSVKNAYTGLNIHAIQRVPVSQSEGFWLFRLRLATLGGRRRFGASYSAGPGSLSAGRSAVHT